MILKIIWYLISIVILFNLSMLIKSFALMIAIFISFPIFVINYIYRKIDEYICNR